MVESPGIIYRHYVLNSKCELVYSEDKNKLINYFMEKTNNNTVIVGSSKLYVKKN